MVISGRMKELLEINDTILGIYDETYIGKGHTRTV